MPFQIGDLIDGHYRVEQRFAGGMGFVYVVLDEIVRKRFAIKQLSELHTANETLLERFRREASTWLQLDYHPHIVQAHSFLPRADAPMLILEFVDGPSLELLLRTEKRLSPAQVLRYAQAFCKAMLHAHSRAIPGRGVGVLHRDIKPGNILITRTNQLKVSDFGLAKILGDSAITSLGQFVGTVAYSSPEQLRAAGEVTLASDVYSFGAVLYQSLSGQPPFKGSNAAELFYAIQESEPKPVGDFIADLSPAFAALVMRCLAKSPAERIPTFDALATALDKLGDVVPQKGERECGRCGFLSRRRVSKCSVCGNVMASSTSIRDTTWKCNCGTSVGAAESVCPNCGRQRERDTGAASDSGKPVATLAAGKSGLVPGLAPDSDVPKPDAIRTRWDLDAQKEYIVELRSGGQLLPWRLDRSGYTVGRDPSMKIRIANPSVSRYHMFLVRLPVGWLAMNPGPNVRLEVNGWEARQHLLRVADLMRLGSAWLAYAGPAIELEPMPLLPGRWTERAGPKAQTIKSGGSSPTEFLPGPSGSCVLEIAGGGRFLTRGQPLRVGSSPLCELRLDDSSVAPVQALLTWLADGPHLVNVTGGLVRLMGGDSFSDHLLRDGDLLQIGKTPIRARIEGDPRAPARMVATAATTVVPRLAITVLTGEQRGQTAIVPIGETVSLGRLSESDFVLSSDRFVSRRHLEFKADSGEIAVRDVGRRSGFFVNQTHFADSGILRLGDVLVIGRTSILVHHELDMV